MKMNHVEALKVFGLSKGVEFEVIKQAYRVASMKYHPDRNPAGLEMMKIINGAWQALSDYKPEFNIGSESEDYKTENYGDELNTALNAIITLGLQIEICGNWVWVSGDTRPHKDVLKEAGFKWAPKKMMWHFRPSDYKSYNRGKWDMDKIREKHGSVTVKTQSYSRIEAA